MQMSNQDRRHSALVGQRYATMDPAAPRELVAGALLHDVGKIECGLGTFGRVVATSSGPTEGEFAAYHDHEEIGAGMAEEAGSDAATVELIAGAGQASRRSRPAITPEHRRCREWTAWRTIRGISAWGHDGWQDRAGGGR